MSQQHFRKVLSTYPTGVCAVTGTAADGSALGMVVGTFTSVSLDPALVGFLADKRSSSWRRIAETGRFCVNVLAADQPAVCAALAAPGTDKFRGVPYSLSPAGQPVVDGCLTRIDCEICSVTEAGDHWFVLGSIVDMDVLRDSPPMLFHHGKLGTYTQASDPGLCVTLIGGLPMPAYDLDWAPV